MRDEEHPRIDSAIVNDSYSTRAPNFRPSFWRFVRYNDLCKFLFWTVVVLLFGGACLGGLGQEMERKKVFAAGFVEFLGGLGVIGAVGVGLLLRKVWGAISLYYENGLLVPGVVVKAEPPELAVVATMSHGEETPCWGLRRVAPGALPFHPHEVGTRVPFVATFQDGGHPDRWGDFDAEPIAFGTGKADRIRLCTDKIGPGEFADLDRCVAHGLVPETTDTIALLDESLRVTETIDRRPWRNSDAPEA